MNTDVPRGVDRDVACPEVCVLTETRGRETHTDSRAPSWACALRLTHQLLRDTWKG